MSHLALGTQDRKQSPSGAGDLRRLSYYPDRRRLPARASACDGLATTLVGLHQRDSQSKESCSSILSRLSRTASPTLSCWARVRPYLERASAILTVARRAYVLRARNTQTPANRSPLNSSIGPPCEYVRVQYESLDVRHGLLTSFERRP